MRRLPVLLAVVGSLLGGQAVAVDAAAAAPCIRVEHRCYPSLPRALAAAEDGDTVRVPAGTYRGGLRITTSITLVGAGAAQTVIRGGGRVLTVGTLDATTQPTVTIKGVTLTGGRVASTPVFGGSDFIAAGAGLQVLPTRDGGPGGRVTVVGSVIRGNRAAPRAQFTDPTVPDWPKCPEGLCPFAGAFGAGIDNWGHLTLRRSRVTGNTSAGRLTSDAVGAGIFTVTGSLTLDRSVVSGNRALAGRTWGRFAEGAGVFSSDGTRLVVRRSSVVENEARLVTDFPSFLEDGTFLEHLANAGGIVTGQDIDVTILSSHIDRNVASVDGPNADDGAINAGASIGAGRLVMRDSTVDRNLVTADLRTAPFLAGGAFQWDGVADIRGSRFDSNVAVITARRGDARAAAAVAAFGAPTSGPRKTSHVRRSSISDNVVTVVAPGRHAAVVGAGLLHNASTVFDHARISGNRAIAVSRTATLQGGGIWNGDAESLVGESTAPPSRLRLVASRVTGNELKGPRGAVRQGGGLWTELPVTLRRTRIAHNVPDQCFGCTGDASQTRTTSAAAVPAGAMRRSGIHSSAASLLGG